MHNARILLAEDHTATRLRITERLTEAGYHVTAVSDGTEALSAYLSGKVDLVLSDHLMPLMDGLTLFSELRRRGTVPFVLYSASASSDISFRAGRDGAVGFLDYPFEVETQLIPTINDTLRRGTNTTPQARPTTRTELLGVSSEVAHLREEIHRYSHSRVNVLVTGETGTGKELVARSLHAESTRADSELVKVNCPALPGSLVESELFGHERGSFTGATKRRTGRFEAADGGTIFLDEIGELDHSTQAKLLQVLQDQRFERVGGAETLEVDVRVLAATNRDLLNEVREGSFREDLYYRLAQVVVHVPPLRERRSDIPVLARAFLEEFAVTDGRPLPPVAPDFFDAVSIQPWPGNARELRATMQRAIIWWNGEGPLDALCFMQAYASTNGALSDSDRVLCQQMLQAFSRASGNQEAARRELGMSRAEWRHRWEKRFCLQPLSRGRR